MNLPEENIDDVLETLSHLAPTAADAPRPAAQALAQLKQRTARPSVWTQLQNYIDNLRRFNFMFRHKYALATLLVLFLFTAAFAFPGVRAAASDFLGIFRVQKFAPISVSPQQLALLREVAGKGLYPGQVEIVEQPGQPQPVDSLSAAGAQAGWTVRTLTNLEQPQSIVVSGGGKGRLTVDLANARTILEAVNVDPLLLPDSLDGRPIDVTTFNTVGQQWENGVMLMQTESPQVDYPADVDPAVLGEALLQVLGMTPGQARRLAQNIDWTNTLLLPIPSDMATFGEVRVDGTTGLALSSLNKADNTLRWQKNGIVYILHGRQSTDELVKLANSLR
jgi:hypothetical protein